MLQVRVQSKTKEFSFRHAAGPLEIGRGPRRDVERHVIFDDLMVSRDHLRVEELPTGVVRLDNLSSRSPVVLQDGRRIETGSTAELLPPLNLVIGATTVVITSVGVADRLGAVETILVSRQDQSQPIKSLRDLGTAPAAQEIAQWLEMAVELQQSADDVAEVYVRTARAMVELLGFDAAQVLTRNGDQWNVVPHNAQLGDMPDCSQTLLQQMVLDKRTLIRNPEVRLDAGSKQESSCAVVSPIFDSQREVVGALYGLRSQGGQRRITELEAQVLQLFAVAASAHRARTEAMRVRIQFEQFFSPELVQELQDHDDLLEGREREITVLVSDLRGFSRLSEQLGPQKTCALIRDLMDRFTHRIIEHGGVIIDYAGDGILAMWNAPVAQADHARRACQAALAMRNELPGLNQKWESLVGGQLNAGIGINTGMAMVGNTGSSRKLKYGPHGSTVNLASRVQDATKVLGLPLLITAQTQERLPPEFATRRLFAARLPGMNDAVGLYELGGTDPSSLWLQQRDTYEAALKKYESGEWRAACQDFVGLMEVYQGDKGIDVPTVRLLRYAWECLECGREIKPIIDLA